MIFTKEDAQKDLVSKMTAKGEKLNLSERSISEQLDTLMTVVANDEMELSEFIEKVFPIFKTADANVRNDVSAGIRAFEDKNPKQDPPKGKQTEGGESELEKRILAMEAELAKTKSEKRISDLKTEVLAKLKEKGVNDEEWSKSLLSLVTFGEEYDVDTNVDSYVSLYNQQAAETGRRTPEGAHGGDSEKALKAFVGKAKAFAAANEL